MIDGSKKHKSLAGVEVQSPYVIERRSKVRTFTYLMNMDRANHICKSDA